MTAFDTAARPGEKEGGASGFYLYAVVLVAAVGGFLFGYDLSLISGASLSAAHASTSCIEITFEIPASSMVMPYM